MIRCKCSCCSHTILKKRSWWCNWWLFRCYFLLILVCVDVSHFLSPSDEFVWCQVCLLLYYMMFHYCLRYCASFRNVLSVFMVVDVLFILMACFSFNTFATYVQHQLVFMLNVMITWPNGWTNASVFKQYCHQITSTSVQSCESSF